MSEPKWDSKGQQTHARYQILSKMKGASMKPKRKIEQGVRAQAEHRRHEWGVGELEIIECQSLRRIRVPVKGKDFLVWSEPSCMKKTFIHPKTECLYPSTVTRSSDSSISFTAHIRREAWHLKDLSKERLGRQFCTRIARHEVSEAMCSYKDNHIVEVLR